MLDRKPEDYVADYLDYCKDVNIDPNEVNSITQYLNEYARWHVMFRGLTDLQSNLFDLEKLLKEKDKYPLEESKKLVESHLDDYSAEKEYNVTYIDGEGKDKEIKFKPSKNTNIAGIQKELGKKQKDFFKLKDIKLTESKKVEEDNEVEGKKLTISERLLQEIIQTVNSKYTLDDVMCQSTPQGNIHITTRDGKDICTVDRREFTISGDDTILIDELRDNGYWCEDLDTLDEEVLVEKEDYDTMAFAQLLPMSYTDYVDNSISDYDTEGTMSDKDIEYFINDYKSGLSDEDQEEFDDKLAVQYVKYVKYAIDRRRKNLTEGTDLSAKDNTVIVNKNQYGYNTIAIIIDDKNKRFQLVTGQSLPTGKYKKASKKAIRDKAEILKDKGYTEVRGQYSLAESKKVEEGKSNCVKFEGTATIVAEDEQIATDILLNALVDTNISIGDMETSKNGKEVTVKFEGEGQGSTDSILDSLNMGADKDKDIISFNIGDYTTNETLEEASTEDIMNGKALSVKDKEILAYIEDRLEAELGRGWRGKSLIDIEDITYQAADQWAEEHDEEINAGAYYKEIKKLTEGKVTTPMGEFEYEELQALEREMKDAFKDYWAKKISAEDLEATKKKLGRYLTNAQISNCQYDASMEANKEETTGEYDDILDGMEDEDIEAVIKEIQKDKVEEAEELTGSGLSPERDAIMEFTDDVETMADEAGFNVFGDFTEETVRLEISKGEARMNVVAYSTEDKSPDYEVTTIGIGGDTLGETILPKYVDGWDYETASPKAGKPNVGDEVYAIFKPMAEATPEEVFNIIKNAFGSITAITEDLEELDDEELIENDEPMYEPVTEYVITFTDTLDEEIYEDQEEADERFEELKSNNELDRVDQYYEKVWVFEHGGYVEDDVTVFYTKGDVVEESVVTEDAKSGMTFGDFKNRLQEAYHNVFPESACTVQLGALGGDTFFVTYYLAKSASECPNGIAGNDLFKIAFHVMEERDRYAEGERLTDETILPNNLVLEVNANSILTKPDNKYMAYGSERLPFRKSKGTPEKILQVLSNYANKTKETLTKLLADDRIPEDRVEFVSSKLK